MSTIICGSSILDLKNYSLFENKAKLNLEVSFNHTGIFLIKAYLVVNFASELEYTILNILFFVRVLISGLIL